MLVLSLLPYGNVIAAIRSLRRTALDWDHDLELAAWPEGLVLGCWAENEESISNIILDGLDAQKLLRSHEAMINGALPPTISLSIRTLDGIATLVPDTVLYTPAMMKALAAFALALKVRTVPVPPPFSSGIPLGSRPLHEVSDSSMKRIAFSKFRLVLYNALLPSSSDGVFLFRALAAVHRRTLPEEP
ncbi:MAG: hypothetical protein WHT81_06620 [Rectinemataceae bacterium]|nr:hypothetical protein [Spirochaetaceae bacterium]